MGRNQNTVIRPDPSDPPGGKDALPIDRVGELAQRRQVGSAGALIAVVMILGSLIVGIVGSEFYGMSDRRLVWVLAVGVLGMILFVLSIVYMQAGGEDLGASIAAATAFDLAPVTAAYRARHGLDEAEALRHEREFRRLAALIVMGTRLNVVWPAPGGALRDYWAEATTEHPALFRAFCESLPGGPSSLPLPQSGWLPDNKGYAGLVIAYGFAFGEEPDPALWPPSAYHGLEDWCASIARAVPDNPQKAAIRALTHPAPEDEAG